MKQPTCLIINHLKPGRASLLRRLRGVAPVGSRCRAASVLVALLLLGHQLQAQQPPAPIPASNAPGAVQPPTNAEEALRQQRPATNATGTNVTGTNAGSAARTTSRPATPGSAMPAPSAPQAPPAPPPAGFPGVGLTPPSGEPDTGDASGQIQLALQNANIDMVVQWLAKTTGKSVVKHPRVNCQLTIVSSRKHDKRDAIAIVYRALSLEGFAVIETTKSIMIVPEGQEPKMSPEVVPSGTELTEGRQRLLKIFPLKNVPAAEIRDKIRAVTSEKATIEIADRSNQLLITDYTENIRLIGELIKELDVASAGDTVIEFFPLKHSEAEELGALLTLILNSQPAPPSSPSSSSRSSSTISRSSSSFPGGPVMMESSSSPMPSPSPTPPSSSSSSTSSPSAAPPIRIWPDKISNRLIVAAQKAKMAEVKRLVDLLDTEKPQDVTIRVLPLKNVSAEDLVRELGPLYTRMSGKSAKDAIEVSASTRANSLVVLSSEANFKAIEKLIKTLDTEDAQEKAMQTFILKNADAEEVAKQLQDLNQDQDSSSRYPFYIFSSYSYGSRAPKKPTFVADRRRNSIVVQASPAALDDIKGLIEALDEPVSDDTLAPRIFRLRYVSATDIEDVLNELFLKRQTQRSYYYDPFGFPSRDSDSSTGAGKLYGKVRITSEPHANALIVTANSRENLAAVEEILKQLDSPSEAGETTLHVELKFANAATIANSLNILFARSGAPMIRQSNQPQVQQNQFVQQQQQGNSPQNGFGLEQDIKEDGYFPWLGGQQENLRTPDGRTVSRPVSDLVGRVRVVPDHRNNALMISASPHFLPQVMKLIDQLDAPTAQVLIEARIVEVSTDFLDKLGVRWSPDGSQTFTAEDYDNSILGKVNSDYKTGFGGMTKVNTPAAGNIPQALTTLRSGVLDTSISMDFLIQFLRKNTDATVLAEPQINIADNELGKLFVGQQVPFIDKSQSTDVGSLNQTFQYKDVGIIVEVTPHINSTGDVALKIRTEASSIVPGQTLFGGAILDTRQFKTEVTAKNGQTMVLGGIIQRQISDTLRKTPGLGSIPGIGWAFKKKDKSSREVELMVFLRPKIIRTPEEAKAMLEDVDRRAPLLKKWRTDQIPQEPKK